MSQQVNVRLPKITREQIDVLIESYGLTKTQVIILAVDRFASTLTSQDPEAIKDIRRLKTVARVIPTVDLGQDE